MVEKRQGKVVSNALQSRERHAPQGILNRKGVYCQKIVLRKM